jgi:molybdate transport system substrate-binding protein
MRQMLLIAGAALVLATPSNAAEIKVMTSGAMAHALQDISTGFAKKNGHTATFTVSTTGILQDKLRMGEKADIIQITSTGMDQLAREKLIDPASRVELARALVGVGVKDGAKLPDISSAASLKAALLAASHVAYIDPKVGGQAGQIIVAFLDKLGITDQVMQKAVYGKTGAEAVQRVVAGEGDIVISFSSEIIPIKGAKLVGNLPAELQGPATFAAAIPVGAPNPELSRALLKDMTTAESRHVMVEAGLEPLGK